jgi:diadenosine tetraphosphatase ApaH/serine/threonine PP2A family protein phosphatase
MKAILSDIHANLEALNAVLDDIARHPVETIYCLGDTVGYGPNPRECLDLVREHCAIALMGNHDLAILHHPPDFNPVAESAVYWTRAQLEDPVPTPEAGDKRWTFLERLLCRHEEGGLMFVHASPCDPIMEYVFPQDTSKRWMMRRLFAEVERCCFQGHTHVPGVFVDPGEFFSPEELDGSFRLGERKVLCNVGSVGQPRDGDLRACYVLLDGDIIRFRRVEYDWQTTPWATGWLGSVPGPAPRSPRVCNGTPTKMPWHRPKRQ